MEGTKTVIYYNVIPDRGFITLQKLTTNQQPTVSGLSPSSATVGGASFTLTVYGNNLFEWFNGEMEWFEPANDVCLRKPARKQTISESDISTVGTASITVRNPSGDISNGMIFEVRNAALTITIQKSGTGTGAVTGTGINCGTDCTEIYTYGTVVTFTATASYRLHLLWLDRLRLSEREYVYHDYDCQ